MERDEFKKWVFEYGLKKGKVYDKFFEKFWTEENKSELLKFTSFMPENTTLKDRIYCLLNDITEQPKCYCGNPLLLKLGTVRIWNQYCSKKCSGKSSKTTSKRKSTNLERFGTDSPMSTLEIQKKRIETNLERYGCEHVMQNQDVFNKWKKALYDNYGSECLSHSKEIREKVNNTWNFKYGKSWVETDDFKKQRKNSLLEHFGVDSPLKNRDVCEKMIQTTIDRYGCIGNKGIHKSSAAELEILDFLNSTGHEFKNTRIALGRSEIDCYCEELKLGIEYCGLYYHSEEFKTDKRYHELKYKLALEKGIRLITIFEDEWLFKKDQIKSFLLATIGKFQKRIYARNTQFIQVDESHKFFQENHIQGRPHNSKYCFQLLHEDEVVGSVSYSLHHRNSSDLVLNRLAFKSGIQIVGGVQKLIRNSIIIVPDRKVVTWSDNRFSTGRIYELNGFVFSGNLPVDYSYVSKQKRIPKQQMKKSMIGCPKNITESDFCKSYGLYRIYDCGKKRWIYNKGV